MSIASRINEMTEHLRNDWNSINKLGLKAKKLPDEYRQVEYIESSGTQYIDTGFAPNENTRTVIDFMPTYAGSLFIFGARLGYNNNAYDLYTSSNKFRDDYANTNYGNASSQPFPKSENKRYLFDKNKNHSIMYEENVQFYDHTFNEQAINLSFNMFLFGVDDNGSVSSNMARMKLYSCKIYDDNTPIRDFVPCYRINDVKVGLYDTINDVFYTNQGAGAFTYGKIQEEIPNKNIKNIAPVLDRFYNQASDKTDLAKNGIVGRTSQNTAILPSEYTQVDYIESSGTQYIDTMVKPINATNIETKVKINDITQARNYVCGCYSVNTSNRFQISFLGDIANYNFMWCRGTQVVRTLISLDANNIYDIKTNGDTLTINNQQIIASGIFNTQSNPIYLFGSNSNGTASSLTNGEKIYYFKIYDNDILVRDFIPCYRNSDNVVGLYDLVNDVFYTNQGTGTFTYGSVVSIPNPDYPQSINNLSGDVEYKVRGKNLLNLNLNKSVSQNGITYNVASDGTITINGTATRTTEIDYLNEALKTTANKKYYLEYIYISGSLTGTMAIFNQDSLHGWSGYDINFSGADASQNRTNGKTYTTDMNMTGAKIIRINNGATLNNLKFKLQFTQSENVNYDYEPYISESFPLSLGDIELCNISDYKDKIYSQNGKFYLEKKTGKVVLDGSESWARHGAYGTPTYYLYYADNLFNGLIDTTNKFGYGYALYFKWVYGRDAENINYSYIRFQYNNGTRVYIGFPNDLSLADFKSWLTTHNTKVQYVLATPTTTKITQENYPTLYSQLLAIQEFLTKYKINKEFLLDYSSPEIEY